MFRAEKNSHKKPTKLVCVQNESVIKLLCCAHALFLPLLLLFIRASFVFEMVSERWMNGWAFHVSIRKVVVFGFCKTVPVCAMHENVKKESQQFLRYYFTFPYRLLLLLFQKENNNLLCNISRDGKIMSRSLCSAQKTKPGTIQTLKHAVSIASSSSRQPLFSTSRFLCTRK
jgi:hypothetical protein